MSDSTYHIVGQVIEVNKVPDSNNWGRTNITKILVKDKGGNTYYGTRPCAASHAIMGTTVRFLAEIRQSKHDETLFLFKDARKMFVEPHHVPS